MRTTREEALQTLGLHDGATPDDIRLNYKKLALKWHPDKNHGNKEATKKFQNVSAAYKTLTSDNDADMMDDEIMSWAEMMQLFTQMFPYRNSRHHHYHHHHHHHCFDDFDDICDGDDTDDDEDDDDDYYFTDDSEDDDDDEEILDSIANRLRNKYEARRYTGKASSEVLRRPITEEEALKNARELIEQEETEKQKEERKRAKRKKKKEKRKQREKEKKIQEEKEKKKQEELIAKQKALAEGKSSTTTNKKGNIPNGPINVQNENKVVKEDTTKNTQDKTISSKNSSRNYAVANGFVSNKKEGQKKKPNDPGSSDEEQIDTKSAFFARAASKAPVNSNSHNSATSLPHNKETVESNKNNKKETINTQKEKIVNKSKNKEEKTEEKSPKMDPIVLQSRQNAREGNGLAQTGDYTGAVKMFSEAIQLDPSDFRFFGNRSYCYDRLGQFDRALKDANEAVSLAPEWPKGYFRKGRALTGLKKYDEAETAFLDVLKLDANCEDAQFELARVRIQRLIIMGFDPTYSEHAIKIYGTVQAACEALISGKVYVREDDGEVYFSDDEKKVTKPPNTAKSILTPATQVVKPSTVTTKPLNQTNHVLLNGASQECSQFSSIAAKKPTTVPSNVDQSQAQKGCSSLWIGNVEPSRVTDKTLAQLFSSCGAVASVRILPAKYCAFVNYVSPVDAAKALEKLQGVQLGDQNLLLRYPNNHPPTFTVGKSTLPTTNSGQKVPSQTKAATPTSASVLTKSAQKAVFDSKVTGPVNGSECYFWRTTGCLFNDRCKHDHFPESKGVDLDKVKAKYGKGM